MGKSYSFKKGYSQVQRKDSIVVRNRIMNALNIKSRPAWLTRLNGKVEPKLSEALAIEAIFREYGISEVWGDDNESECTANQA